MAELVNTKCKQGRLILTDTAIIVELKGFGKTYKSETLMRPAFTNIDYKQVIGSVNLVFHGQGNKVLKADWVKPEDAQKIQAI